MKTVLFALNSSYTHTNLAVRCLKKSLESKQTCEAVILERTIKDRRINVLSDLFSLHADVYCFSVYIWNVREMLSFAAQLKELLPQSRIVFGGPEVSFEDESFFEKNNFVDYIISGEGEDALPELICEIEKGSCKSHRIIFSPLYEGFDTAVSLYSGEDSFDSSILYYESSRGCPYNCSYCLSSTTRGVRGKPADVVLDELREFEKKSGVRIIKFVDRTFNYDRERAKKIWQALLLDEFTKNYHFEICADLVDEETIDILSQFPDGKIQLEIGIQSTNSETLRAINRTSDTEKCISVLNRLHEKKNIHLHADLIAGLPFEDYESFSRSFDSIYGRCDKLQLGFLKMLKGSAMRENAEKFGIKFDPNPPYEVLKTSALDFPELVRLHAIDDVVDRFSGSTNFENTLSFVFGHQASPFRFFEGLSDYISERFLERGYSQIKAFEVLVSFSKLFLSLDEAEEKKLLACARLDFLISENGSVPTFLHGDVELPVVPIIKAELIRQSGFSKQSTEVHRFFYDPNGYYVIDRREHRVKRSEWN